MSYVLLHNFGDNCEKRECATLSATMKTSQKSLISTCYNNQIFVTNDEKFRCEEGNDFGSSMQACAKYFRAVSRSFNATSLQTVQPMWKPSATQDWTVN